MLKTLVGVHNLPKTEEKFVKFMANSRNFKDEKASKKVFKEIVKGAERIKQDQLKAEKPKKMKDGQIEKPKKVKIMLLIIQKSFREERRKPWMKWLIKLQIISK
jgi:hypothetical protein